MTDGPGPPVGVADRSRRGRRRPVRPLPRGVRTHNPRLPGGQGGDVTNDRTHDEMLELGGEDQIPFLVDTARDVTMYESDDIVDYLEEHYG
ncbi:hypothetical protein BRD09_05045 [Halobacteriales archaeon SW_10_68_16]|nr:MAG: hypothetical protein BRD09_05045 [Halobacteriales archaeon SW_10_68_16]